VESGTALDSKRISTINVPQGEIPCIWIGRVVIPKSPLTRRPKKLDHGLRSRVTCKLHVVYTEPVSTAKTITVYFSIAKTEQSRLDHLVEVFSGGNRSAFLRMAMDRMEVADRAQRLRSIQTYGSSRSVELGISSDAVSDRVKRVLARRAEA
jgi:hypothetical protein